MRVRSLIQNLKSLMCNDDAVRSGKRRRWLFMNHDWRSCRSNRSVVTKVPLIIKREMNLMSASPVPVPALCFDPLRDLRLQVYRVNGSA